MQTLLGCNPGSIPTPEQNSNSPVGPGAKKSGDLQPGGGSAAMIESEEEDFGDRGDRLRFQLTASERNILCCMGFSAKKGS